ncbi:MAG: heme A synthase [Gemmatimonadaceae bacterium]|nr:heme A synthase [Gemmatimonadaceae bacterium]
MTTSQANAPASVRLAAYAALVVSLVHIVFGAIVRITGSGMGCGDNWPKCYGRWFPPLERMDLIIEVFHRYLAITLFAAIAVLAVLAWRHRAHSAVGGKGGVWNAALLSVGLWFAPALFGAVTVFAGNPPWATVVHKALAATLLAMLAVATVRAGGLGGASIVSGSGSRKAIGGTTAAAVMALLVILLGGLTAKLPGAAVACAGFPLCGEGSTGGGAQHVQLTHRVLAYLLVLHLISLPFVFRKRGEPSPMITAAWVALGLGVLQIVWAGWMVTGGFPNVVRSLHQATGMFIWVTAFVMTYLARRAAGQVAQ